MKLLMIMNNANRNEIHNISFSVVKEREMAIVSQPAALY